MTAPLDDLRRELDAVDRAILETAARRNRLVREIAAAKLASGARKPLFDREREREVYARAARTAREVGLDPRVAEHLVQVLVEGSHQSQEAASRAAALGATEHARRFLIVGGAGRMGCLLGGVLESRGHFVDVLEPGDARDRAAVVAAAEIVIVSVPMHIAAEVAGDIAPLVEPDGLLCDVNSLKTDVCAAMAACRGEAMGLHPMFGPTVASLRRQKIVVCPVSDGPLCAWWRAELGQTGAELIESTPEQHDRMMAMVQVLTHFSTLVMGETLRRSGVTVEESLAFTSPIYRLELAFVGRLFAQDPGLYAEIEMTNPHGPEVRRAYRQAADALAALIDTGDRDAFAAMFRSVAMYFHGFEDDAMTMSDRIIEALVVRP